MTNNKQKKETNNNNVMEETGVENVDKQETNANNETQAPINVLDNITLEKIICDAITEHAESRTERYEVYQNRDNGIYKPKFTRVVRTYAKLATIRRPNATIRLVDKYGEERLLNAQAYQAPDFLYDVINYSGRIYLCDEDRENENYITEATRKASDLSDDELSKEMLSPEDLLSFWRDYNSTTKHQVKMQALTKPAIAFSDLSGIVKIDSDVKAGYVFKRFNTNASVSMTTVQARMIRFDALSGCGAETKMLETAQIVHRLANATTSATVVPETKEQEFVNGSDK